MSIEIRKGTIEDVNSLEMLYNNLNDYLEATTNYPGWRKGVYPIREDAVSGIEDNCLYVATENNEIVGSIILRSTQEPAYLNAIWQAALSNSEVLVIHTFVVNPRYLKCGIGRKLLDFASQFALKENIKALRLDVYEKNSPAISLYEKCGFKYIDTVSLGLECYGLDRFMLYEKLVWKSAYY